MDSTDASFEAQQTKKWAVSHLVDCMFHVALTHTKETPDSSIYLNDSLIFVLFKYHTLILSVLVFTWV